MKRLGTILTVVAAASLAACGGGGKGRGAEGAPVAAKTVPAAVREMPSGESYVGNVRSRQAVTVSTKMMGRVLRFAVDEGQAVKRGQLLVEVDAAEAQSAYLQSKAGTDAADTAVRNAERDYARFKALSDQKAVTQHQLEQAEMGLAAAKAQRAQAEANLGMSKTLLSYGRITAPEDGLVTRRWLDAGNLAYPGAPLLTLENPADLELSVQVPEERARLLAPGQRAAVTVDGGARSLEAALTAAVPAADPMTRTSTVKLALPQGAGLLPGQFASVRFAAFAQKALAVPEGAVVTRGQMDAVFVAASGAARLRYLQLGARAGGFVQVLAGLKEGEAVVCPVPEGLRDGDRLGGAP